MDTQTMILKLLNGAVVSLEIFFVTLIGSLILGLFCQNVKIRNTPLYC